MTTPAYRFLPDDPATPLSMPRLQTVLLDPAGQDQATVLEVLEGVGRVYCPCEETEGMTLAFLQSGDRLRTDRICSEGACVEALTALKFRRNFVSTDEPGVDAVNEWTLQLLRVRHLGQAEQRLHALLVLLVNRLGFRSSDAYQLPFRLTHDRFGELIGATRVTTTRLLSKWRQADLVSISAGGATMWIAPDFFDSSPLQF